ncbi:hypothetical protein KBA63_00665 [Candidatus Woesebacteria bacterium]|nr:hypothetical protein [Candidatus Woesebacteria bacterium]
MKRFLTTLIVLIMVLFAPISEARALAPTVEQPQMAVGTPQEMIERYASIYGANPQKLLKTAYCESKLSPNPKGHNDGGRAFGILQFHKPTFDGYAKRMGEKLDYYSYHDQIKLAAWMWGTIPSTTSQWTCYS